ncbi:sirohydrochlorin chelatase [Polaromonas sp. JS666]|uniref:sirohydrochlorin chelatase n=1 Tax=Polaromonas sp. (strain JS666 / ATCC BAA-500) TaxID=296591 RepID=UPI0000464144|nr:CbiX/SirB N-terminal domain-containing protein [Polaromonas sp. JS666]ABE44324.1 cobalamin (vitamin B12) biosynthesis CbiX protein [Polaromonas sp. JS666]UUZ73885.1 CbiX/SirB N-terminal domain-containing protein [Polaromonas sp. P1(28)-8]
MTPSNPTPAGTGIVLFAHGSRDPHWRAPIEAVAAEIRSRQPGTPVRCAYLELSAPSLPEAATDLIAEGVQRIRVFPLFLGVGKHAREDFPLLVEQIRAAHPGVAVELLPTAGEYQQLTTLMADIALS